MQTLLVQQQHAATVVNGAAVGAFLAPGQQHLVTVSGDTLRLFDLTEDQGLQLQHTVPLFAIVDAAFTVPAAAPGQTDRLLLISASLHRGLLVSLSTANGQARVHEQASVQLQVPAHEAPAKRMDGPCCSKLWSPHGDASITHTAVALYSECVHLLTIKQPHSDTPAAAPQLGCDVLDLRKHSVVCATSECAGPSSYALRTQ